MRTERDAIYDALLVVRWQRGDRSAIEELLGRWDRRLLYYVRRLVDGEQDAWDVLQRQATRAANPRGGRGRPCLTHTTGGSTA